MSRRNNTISLPTEPLPDAYKTQELNEESEIPVIKKVKQIPSATLHGNKNNLKKIKSFKSLRQSYKVSNQQTVFLTDMKTMLDHLSIDDNKFNLELLIEVSNIANQFFIYGNQNDREESKIQAVHELLLPYFQNDSDILEAMLVSVQNKIKKSTLARRLFKRVYNFFCSIERQC